MVGFSSFPPEQEITSGKFKVMRIQVERSLPFVRKWSKFAAFMHAKECPSRKIPLLLDAQQGAAGKNTPKGVSSTDVKWSLG